MKCISCGKEIDTKKKYCKYCGTEIEKSIEANNAIAKEERDNTANSKKFVKCQSCGEKTYAHRNFCVHCGAPLTGENDSEDDEPQGQDKGLKKAGIAIVSVILLLVISATVFLFARDKVDINRIISAFGRKESSVVEAVHSDISGEKSTLVEEKNDKDHSLSETTEDSDNATELYSDAEDSNVSDVQNTILPESTTDELEIKDNTGSIIESKISDNDDASRAETDIPEENINGTDSSEEILPFYGIWCFASQKESEAQKAAEKMRQQGIDAQVFVTTDWSNLNSSKYYVVTAGIFQTEEEAKDALSDVQELYKDAYIKYSGQWRK